MSATAEVVEAATPRVAVTGAAPAAQPRASTTRNTTLLVAAFLAAHVVLALGVHHVHQLADVHMFAALAVGIFVAVRRPARDVACAISYIAGSEVLWRMSHAMVFYEFAKYAVTIVIVVALIRMRARRNRTAALLYLGLLLPSAILTFSVFSAEEARQQLSFNLAGPMSLAFCIIYFSNIRLSLQDLRRVFVTFIGPALGVAAYTYIAAAAIRDLEFTGRSTLATSGGFGPNQVSATLGLGLLFALLLLFQRNLRWRHRGPLLALSAVFAVQAALTFSRGGLFLALAAAFAAMIYLVRNARTRITLAVLATIFAVVGKFVVVPRLETFTQGKLGERYSQLDSDGRTLLASFDLEIFASAPLMGVGPGGAVPIREEMGHIGAAHTEYTRLLAEHGMLGIGAILMLVVIGLRVLRGTRGIEARAFVIACFVWFALYLAIDAMRMVAPSFMFGLACAIGYSSRPPRPKPKRVVT